LGASPAAAAAVVSLVRFAAAPATPAVGRIPTDCSRIVRDCWSAVRSGSTASSVRSTRAKSSVAATRAITLSRPTTAPSMLSMRSSTLRSKVCWYSSVSPEGPGPSAPRRSGVKMRPLSSTTVTASASSPSTLAATRCTMPSIWARASVRPCTSLTTTDAEGLRSAATKSERSGSARCTRADSTPPNWLIVRPSSPWSARW
jgi:hypothetical protein